MGDKKFIFVLIRNRIEAKDDIIIQNVLIAFWLYNHGTPSK